MERDNFDTDLFINEVEKKVAIWDMESSDYSNRVLKRRNWAETGWIPPSVETRHLAAIEIETREWTRA